MNFLIEVWKSRRLLATMILRDVKTRFAGSALGIFWAFLQPLCMMLILWFVFTYGLKASPGGSSIPFVAWFFPAQIAWNFFQEAMMTGSCAVTDYAFLVRKVNFKVELLPIVKLGSSLVFHGVFLMLLMAVLLATGVAASIHWLYFVYFTICGMVLLLGLGWLTSSLTVLFRDVQQLLGVVAQLGFWATPIIWKVDALPEQMRPWMALNPIYYITEGYRQAFTATAQGVAFKVETLPGQTLVFWIMAIGMLFWGRFVFRRLRPYFGDIL